MAHLRQLYVACLCLGLVAGTDSFTNFGHIFFNRRPSQCGTTSLATVTRMSNPAGPSGDCTLTIRAGSWRVCQLRIDFDMDLAQPGTTVEKPYPHCIHDALLVDGLPIKICGRNIGQHVYVPWRVQRPRDTKTITIRIADRRLNADLPAATWQLRVTKIECQGSGLFGRDSALRAPSGCLQYFTEPTGTFESFNLNNRVGPYLGGLTYGICFRRHSHHGEFRLQAEFFETSQSAAAGPGYDADCSSQVITAQSRQDFLAVREAYFMANNVSMVANRFCGTGIAAGQAITSRAPGSFMIQFSTDQQTSAEEKGFRFTYSIV